ncbi:class A beta-lactamase-related serine hydrolase [bacterium]|nr:MAG: class A beta-lactamase-related serine hydrolase [bacterium]
MLPLALASLMLRSPTAGAEIGNLAEANKVAARLVELFNGGDAPGVSAQAEPEYLEAVGKERLSGLVQRVHSMGTLSAPKLVVDLGEQRQYRVVLARKEQPDLVLLLKLGVGRDGKLFALGLDPEKPSVVRTEPLATDNPGKNGWDKAVQAAVARFAEKNSTVGISVAVAQGNRQAFYNYGEVESGVGVIPTPRTVYEIGSITKTMTGFLIGQAILDGKLDLDADIRSYLPGMYPNLEFEGKPILLRHLVTHTSGLPANPPGIPDDGKADAYARYNHAALLSDLEGIKLTRLPGSTYGYSNMGGGLAGLILERTYGQPFEALLKRHIFSPAKMTRTGIALTPEMDRAYALPYDNSRAKTDRWIVNGIESAGAVRSTPEDMLRYARFSLDGKNRAAALSQRLQSPKGLKPFGLFWVRADSRLGGAYVNHEGGTGGFTGHILLMPKKRLSVVVLTNSGEEETGPLAYEIALRLLK